MSQILIDEIKSHLKSIKDVDSKDDIVKTKTLNEIIIENKTITIILNISKPKNLYNNISIQIEKIIIKKFNNFKLNILLTSENNKPKIENMLRNEDIKPEGINHIIAVASGKGGVGKSTISTNLAISLSKLDYKIGILDADIYGPSQPEILGLENYKPTQNNEGKINIIEKYGIKCMSIGFLIEPTRPMIWRGPMIQSALQQLIKDVDWGKLDILIVDMPPGTGDVQLTMTQKVQLSGAIIVSTPQDIALQDAIKGLNMFKKVEVPIVGLIENMSYHICPKCNEKTMIFGSEGVKNTAKRFNIPFLGKIPLDISIRKNSDKGTPDNNIFNEDFENISKKVINFIFKNKK